jgi:hypothetical protein
VFERTVDSRLVLLQAGSKSVFSHCLQGQNPQGWICCLSP